MSQGSEVANTELVLLAMALAGAGDDYVDVEDIAIQAYELSPQRFGWRTRSFPSDKIVVQAIADLEGRNKGKERDRLTSRGADKIATRRLTSEGRRAALAVGAKIAGREFGDLPSLLAHFKQQGSAAPEPTPAERRRVQAELGELRRHRTYQQWADEGDLDGSESWQLLDALSCLPDAPQWAVREQTERLRALAERWQDEEVLDFLDALSRALTAEDIR